MILSKYSAFGPFELLDFQKKNLEDCKEEEQLNRWLRDYKLNFCFAAAAGENKSPILKEMWVSTSKTSARSDYWEEISMLVGTWYGVCQFSIPVASNPDKLLNGRNVKQNKTN